MDAVPGLRATLAPFLGLDPAQLSPATPLDGRLRGSIGRAALDAALRRALGRSHPAVYDATTVGDLEAAFAGGAPGGAAAAPGPPRGRPAPEALAAPGVACGIDLEHVAALPAAADYWAADFYRTNFSPAEIAYCVRQPEPREHFAARWCAKEALKKCDARFAERPMGEIEVVRREAGHPALHHGGELLPHAVSLSHSADFAVAVVVSAGPPVAPAPGRPGPVPRGASPAAGRAALLLALLAVLLSACAAGGVTLRGLLARVAE